MQPTCCRGRTARIFEAILSSVTVNPPTPKYRSKVRDEPRYLKPTDYRSPPPPPGTIRYHSDAPLLSDMLRAAKTLNRNGLSARFSGLIASVVECMDSLHALAAVHAWTLTGCPDAIPHPANHVLFPCFHKGLLNLHAAHELTLDGLYGLARPHLRQAFESLMIAKMCATDPESDVFDKWIDGLDLYFTKAILKRLVHPDMAQFLESWGLLCRWTHATVFAGQLSMDLETTEEEAAVNLAFIGVLLNFLDHLLGRHILTPTIKYYVRRYGNEERLVRAKSSLRTSLSSLQPHLGLPSRRLVRDYRATWQLK